MNTQIINAFRAIYNAMNIDIQYDVENETTHVVVVLPDATRIDYTCTASSDDDAMLFINDNDPNIVVRVEFDE